jgi:hypothetical protein
MITDNEWQAFMDDFQLTLDKFEVPEPERQELIAIVESTKEAIVVEPFQEGTCDDNSAGGSILKLFGLRSRSAKAAAFGRAHTMNLSRRFHRGPSLRSLCCAFRTADFK